MSIEHKLKGALLITSVDVILKGAERSPKRCCRNLLELGRKAYPDKLTKKQQKELKGELIALCKSNNIPKLKELFLLIYSSV